MQTASRSFWQGTALAIGAVLVAPVFVALLIGRIVFFAALSLGEAVHRAATPSDDQARAGLLPFWLAWLMAILLLAGMLAGGVFVVARTKDWVLADQLAARGIVVLLALAGLYLAFRLALYGTAVLQRVLAHNLARLIAFELDDLRAQADQRAAYLVMRVHAVGATAEAFLPPSPALPVPHFFADTDDIAKLLGEPVERALEDLLLSLSAFNSSLKAASLERLTRGVAAREQAHLHVRQQLIRVHEHLAQAMQIVNPLCRRHA